MKIDLHCHTKATKGEDVARNIEPENLIPILKQKMVELVAVTNHNQFDYDEFIKMVELGEPEQIKFFPGVELDVIGIEKERAHVIVIVDPHHAIELNKLFGKDSILTPKDYAIPLNELLSRIEGLDFIFVAHYQKKPELLEESLELVYNNVDSYRVFLEPSNFRGLSINSNKGHSCIMGSDVTDWAKYLDEETVLPSLKLKVESFKEFILLAKKDKTIVETLLNRTRKTKIEVKLRRDKEKAVFRTENIELYDDINVIFGGKGSGKSKYLEFINESLKEKGENPVYYNSDEANDLINDYRKVQAEEFDARVISEDLVDTGFSEIKDWKTITPTPLERYFDAVKTNLNKRNRKYLSIVERSSLPNKYDNTINNSKTVYEKISRFKKWLTDDFSANDIGIDDQEHKDFLEVLSRYESAAFYKYKEDWIGKVSVDLSNNAISCIKNETDILSDGVSIPSKAGLEDKFVNSIKPLIEVNAFLDFLKKESTITSEKFGALEEDKTLYLNTTFSPLSDSIKAANYSFKSKNLTTLRSIGRHFTEVFDAFGSTDYDHQLVKLQNILDIENVDDISEFVCISRRFSTEGDDYYTPSSGEAKVIAFQKALETESKYYLLDEPEKSLGSSYTTSVILPQIKRLAQLGKCVVCTTHSANIAVLGMPYQTILKEYSNREYLTYIGNMYLNKLECISDSEKVFTWSDRSVELLEGGEHAFSERKYAYAIKSN